MPDEDTPNLSLTRLCAYYDDGNIWLYWYNRETRERSHTTAHTIDVTPESGTALNFGPWATESQNDRTPYWHARDVTDA